MSTTNQINDTERNQSTTTDLAEADSRKCTHWTRDNGRQFITDPNGDVVNIARLTAYAEYGDAIYDAHAHHELPLRLIDAPDFLAVLSETEHGRFHGADPEPVMVDGIPRLRPGGEDE